jgi:hypothetical protein
LCICACCSRAASDAAQCRQRHTLPPARSIALHNPKISAASHGPRASGSNDSSAADNAADPGCGGEAVRHKSSSMCVQDAHCRWAAQQRRHVLARCAAKGCGTVIGMRTLLTHHPSTVASCSRRAPCWALLLLALGGPCTHQHGQDQTYTRHRFHPPQQRPFPCCRWRTLEVQRARVLQGEW